MVEIHRWFLPVFIRVLGTALTLPPGDAVQRQEITILGLDDVLLMCVPIQSGQFPKVFSSADSRGECLLGRRCAACTRKTVKEHLRAIIEPSNDGLGEERHSEVEECLDAEEGETDEEGDVFLERESSNEWYVSHGPTETDDLCSVSRGDNLEELRTPNPDKIGVG